LSGQRVAADERDVVGFEPLYDSEHVLIRRCARSAIHRIEALVRHGLSL
jgi:hypothetical protein